MAKKKEEGGLICIEGCSIAGKRINIGDPMPKDVDPVVVRRLIALGRFADQSSVKESPKSDDDDKTSGADSAKLPGVE